MTDLVARLREAMDTEERDAESGRGGFPHPVVWDDGGMVLHVMSGGEAAVLKLDDGPAALEALKRWASPEAQGMGKVRRLRMVAAHRKILDLHAPTWENVEWPHAADDRGKNWVCPSCRPKDPTEWHPEVGEAGVLPEGFVASYTVSPCPTLAALAEAYGVEA